MSEFTVLTPDLMREADQICSNYPVKRAAALPVMRLVQDYYGAISSKAELEIAEYFNCPAADIRELMTFYTLFYSKPKGRCHIQVCKTLSCAIRGAQDMVQYLESKIGIKTGETSPDGQFSLDQVECLGACEIAPMAKINLDFVGPLTKEKLSQVLRQNYAGIKG